MKTILFVVVALVICAGVSAVQARPTAHLTPLDDLIQQASAKSQQHGFTPQSTSLGLMWVGTGEWQDSDVLGLASINTDGSYVVYQYNKNANGFYRDTGYYLQGVVNAHDDMSGVYSDPSGTPMDSLNGGYMNRGVYEGYWYFTWKSTGIFTYGRFLPLVNS